MTFKNQNNSSATPASGPQRVAWARQKAAAESRRRAAKLREEGKRSSPAPAKKEVTHETSAPACGPQRVAWARQEAALQERRRVAVLRQQSEERVKRHMPRTVSEATVPLLAPQHPSDRTLAPLQKDVATEVAPHAAVLQNAAVPPAASADKTTPAEQTRPMQQEIVVKESAPVTEDSDSSQSVDGHASVEGDDMTLTGSWDDSWWDDSGWDDSWWDDSWWDDSLGLDERLENLTCPIYFVLFHYCDHCLNIMTEEELEWCYEELKEVDEEMQAERRKRVKELNAAIKKEEKRKRRKAERREAKGKNPRPETPPRSRRIRFNLNDVPNPVKDREFLYEDYSCYGEGMLEQWRERLHELGDDEAAWRQELEALAAGRGWRGEGLDHTDRYI